MRLGIQTSFRSTVWRLGNSIGTIGNVVSAALRNKTLVSLTTYWWLSFQFILSSSFAHYVSIFKHMPRPWSNKEILCILGLLRVTAKPETVSQKQIALWSFSVLLLHGTEFYVVMKTDEKTAHATVCYSYISTFLYAQLRVYLETLTRLGGEDEEQTVK